MNFSQLILILLARKRIILLTLLVTVGTTALVSLLMPKKYSSTASVLVDVKGIDPITGMVLPAQAQLLPGIMATQVDIIASHNVALRVVDRLKLADRPEFIEDFNDATDGQGSIRDWIADQLLKKYLDVTPSRESSVIDISYLGPEPQFAADMANAFAQAYIQTNLELKVEPARNQALWFDEQIKSLRNQVEVAQKKLSDYQQKTGIIAVDERLDVENARLAELSTQLVAAQAQTYDSMTRQRELQQGGASAKGRLAEIPEIMGNLLIQNLKTELARAEARFSEVSKRVDKNHPQYQSAQAEVESLRKKLSAEIQTARGSIINTASLARHKEEEIKRALAEQKSRVLELKQQRDQVSMLTREVENAQQALNNATQRGNQMRLESQRNQTEIAILSPAVAPIKPAKPRLLLNLAIAIFLGSLLGVGLGLLMELLDRRIRSEDDIVEGLGMPLLAVISAPAAAQSKGLMRRFPASSEGMNS